MNLIGPVWIICLLMVESTWALLDPATLACVQCSSVDDSINCPAGDFVLDLDVAKKVNCENGACYSTMETINGKVESVRGCSNDLEGMPDPIPPDGVYKWHDKTINVCVTEHCNLVPPESDPLDGDFYGHQKKPVDIAVGWDIDLNCCSRMCVYCDESATGLSCVQCSSVDDSINCPAGDFVLDLNVAKKVNCENGACYSTMETINGKVESVRGCTNDLEGMPDPIPPDGVYKWHDKTINVCVTEHCNLVPPDSEPLDGDFYDHQKKTVDIAGRGPIKCIQCMNYDAEGNQYPQCPKDEAVVRDKAFSGECNSTCFTRTFGNDPNRVARGCTDTQWGLPYPLPPDGCYNWENGVWCVCNTHECNGKAIGKSSGKELDDHLYAGGNEDFEEKDGKNRCFECINYDAKGTYYKQCPKHKRVRNAFVSVCNGSCFTRSYDYDVKKVARGCTATQWGLPNPLPPDGCYKWYSEVWCVCSKTRCNRNAIGKAQDIEFDAHIPQKDKGGPNSTGIKLNPSESHVTSCLFLVIFQWLFRRHFYND